MTQPPEEDAGGQVRPFAAVLQELAKGQIHDRASQALHEVVQAVIEHEKKGTVTVKIEVAPIAKHDVSVLVVTGDVESRPPKTPPANAFFVDDTGNLSRRDPKQPELPFTVAGAAPAGRQAQ